MTQYPGDFISKAIAFSINMLSEHREFYPYGFAERSDGKFVDIGMYYSSTSGIDLQIESDGILKKLKQINEESGLKCVAVVYNVSTTHPSQCVLTDAVRVFVETNDGFCSHVFFPYTMKDGLIALGAPYMTRATPVIFASGS